MSLARDLASIVFVLAFLFAALWMLRRSGSGLLGAAARGSLLKDRLKNPLKNSPRQLEKLERITLTPQHTLHLVRFVGREFLVSTHPHGCSVLAEGPTVSKDVRDDERKGANA